MKKLGKYGAVLLLIIAAVFNVVVFVFPHSYKASFWWGYGFTMFAFLSQIGITALAFGKFTSLEKTFLGISISQLGFKKGCPPESRQAVLFLFAFGLLDIFFFFLYNRAKKPRKFVGIFLCKTHKI